MLEVASARGSRLALRARRSRAPSGPHFASSRLVEGIDQQLSCDIEVPEANP
jgi:hypothetical protein